MNRTVVFYNPLAGRNNTVESLSVIKDMISDEISFCDMTDKEAYAKEFKALEPEDKIILCGGDGTLNRFINMTETDDLQNEVLYYPCGSGNDFAHDVGKERGDAPFSITKYIHDLPFVEVNGKKQRFLNGIGYGIDGYCCEVGDMLKEQTDKPINYTSIAIKGLLFHFKPTDATIIVDGKKYEYKKVWLTPTMNGRFYGGGMMPTPNQDRLGGKGLLSTMVFHDTGKIRTLTMFPSIFKGEHIKYKGAVEILTGHDITVKFERPTALQIDGETVKNVTEYRAYSAQLEQAGKDAVQFTTAE